MMLWDETDVISVLEVLPEIAEEGVYHDFRVEQHGLTLQFTVFQFDGDVRVRLWREGLSEPIFEMQIMDSPGIRRLFNSDGKEYLEIAAGKVWQGRPTADASTPAALFVSVKPQIAVRASTYHRA